MHKLRWLLLSVAVFSLSLIQATGYCRVLGVKLTGEELLVEFAKTGPGKETPGIYAVSDAGKLTLVVPYARNPRWSPSHRQFAFTMEGVLWIGNLDRATMQPVGGIGPGSLVGNPLPTAGSVVVPPIVWLPDERGLVVWETSIYMVGAGQRKATVLSLKSEDEPLQIFTPMAAVSESIGRVTFHSDGRRVACEVYRATPDLGASSCAIHIGKVGTNTFQTLQVPKLGATAMLNPQWEPGGKHLALDYLDDSRQRRSVIIDPQTQVVYPLPTRNETEDYMQVLAWSPTGSLITVLSGSGRPRLPQVFEVKPGKQPRVVGDVGGLAHCYQACWSPKGDRIAALTGDALSRDEARSLELGITPLRGEKDYIRFPPHLRPMAMDW